MRFIQLLAFSAVFNFCNFTALQAQARLQKVRGTVVDQQSQSPLPGVNILLEHPEAGTFGASTDGQGRFAIEAVPMGRIALKISFIGYESLQLSQLEHLGSKELVLNLEMRESTTELAEVTIYARNDKERTNNERVNVSGRSFSIEESQRFAGANQDVARMASNFAGVQRSNDATNDIVIRGNSPNGLIWRLEGVDIPNPNHFGGFGATGGPVSMLNNNVLANSDFITGAFPADYGDGLAGVFDLRLREGNNQQHEFLGQIGFNGLELGAEGPINRAQGSSYLLNYRYSTLGVMSALGIDFGTGTAIPEYQDLNMKLHFPSRKRGTIQVFALGGISAIDFLDSENEEGEDGGFFSDNQDLRNRVNTGVLGVSHRYFFSKQTYSKLILSATGTQNRVLIDTSNRTGDKISPNYRQNFQRASLQLHAFVNHKLNVKHVLRLGAFLTRHQYLLVDSVFRQSFDEFVTLTDNRGGQNIGQPYANWQWRLSDEWEMNTGFHSMILGDGSFSLEPRWGMSYRLSPRSSINLGYGLHSQRPSELVQFRQVALSSGQIRQPNLDLGFTRSHHGVVGFRHGLKSGWQLVAEAYYQDISDALTERAPSSYSALNAGSFDFFIPDSAQNGGRGYNYGLDLTLEKYLDRGFYFLSTLSLFESGYLASDGQWRNTAFNGNYVWNMVGGQEILLKQSATMRQSLTIDAKVTWAGGQRYTPIDLEASRQRGETVFQSERAYSGQYRDYFRADLRIGYKRAGAKTTQEWAFDVQNLSNRDNPFGQSFNAATGEIEQRPQLGLFPMMLYRISF